MKRSSFLSYFIFLICIFAVESSVAQTSSPLLPVCPKSDKCGFIDHSGKIVIKATFLDVQDFSEGLAAVKINTRNGEKYGFIDTAGKIVIDAQFDEALPFSDGLARFKENESYGFVNSMGKQLPTRFEWAKSFSQGLAVVGGAASSDKPDQQKAGFINTKGDLVIGYEFDSAEPFSEDLAAACISRRKCGYINKEGTFAIQPTFEHTGSFSEGFAIVASIGDMTLHNFGYIDKSGKVVIPQKYSNAKPFSEGLAAVAVAIGGGPYGYINTKGTMVIAPQYYQANDFSEGLAVVLVESSGEYFNKYAYIDQTGMRNTKKSYSSAGKFMNGFATIEKRNVFAKLDVPMGKLAVCSRHYINKKEQSIWKETNFGCN